MFYPLFFFLNSTLLLFPLKGLFPLKVRTVMLSMGVLRVAFHKKARPAARGNSAF